jgi:hypothetical protein
MKTDRCDEDIMVLRAVLEKAGVEIRTEAIAGEGGLVRMDGRIIVFVPLHSAKRHVVGIFLDSIQKLAGSLGHIPPRVRQLLGEEDWHE